MTKEDARARVAKGAALLDQQVPGWAARIDAGTLSLHNPFGCVLGQIDGFSEMANRLFGNEGGTRVALLVSHGFDFNLQDVPHLRGTTADAPERVALFAPLQDAWIEAIADRLHPVTTPEPAEAVQA